MSPFIDIKLTAESIDMIVMALRKLPHEQVHELVVDLLTQKNAPKKRRGRPPRAKVAN